jgi:cobalt/nickel transport system permease protein
MHIHIADSYHEGDSFVHRLDPRVKVLSVLLFVLAASLIPPGAFGALGLLLAFVLVAAAASGVGIGYLIRRSFIALPFALAAVTLLFTVPGNVIVTIPIFGGLEISDQGLIRFLTIMFKSWISVQMAILLVAVTPFPQVLWALRALHVPQPLVSIASFMYRYLFVLSDEALRLLRARSSRSAAIEGHRSGGPILWRGKVAGRMAGSLMIRSFERSERIYNAMIARGYTGQVHTLQHPHLHRQDYVTLVAVAFYLSAVLTAAYVLQTV